MKKIKRLKVSLDFEFKAAELVKVKAHKRIRNGKVVKVRSGRVSALPFFCRYFKERGFGIL